MERDIHVQHVSLSVDAGFDAFTRNLERLLGRFDDSYYEGLESDPVKVRERLEKVDGKDGLLLFTVRDHGKLLNIAGVPKKAKQYVVGNPLIAVMMTRHDIRAGLYAPLRVFVYEGDDHATYVEYDRPSSLFGQFDNPEITAIAGSLDEKLESLIERAGQVLCH